MSSIENAETTSAKSTITGHVDPEGEAPWAMQLVVRVEKADPPTRTAACEAAAIAVVRLLASDEAQGEWKPAIDRWLDGRIRKHCRRARGAKWDRVQALPGVTVEHAGAEVRAFVPCSTNAIPAELGKLQLSGLELDDPEPNANVEPIGPVLVTSLQPDPYLPAGKAAAAVAHAAQLAWLNAPAGFRSPWADAGFPVAVEQPTQARFEELVRMAPVVVHDAGLTVVRAGVVTSVARWKLL